MFSRSLSSALKRDTSYQDAQMQWLQEISAVLQHYVDFPAVDIPDVMKGLTYRQLRDEDIEGIAQELRSHWRLAKLRSSTWWRCLNGRLCGWLHRDGNVEAGRALQLVTG